MPQDNAGNNLLTANNIGIPGSSNHVYQDWVGGSDRNDYYRFFLTQTQNFRASLTGLNADADIEVLDWRGQRVRGQEGVSRNAGTTSESINLDGLGAGIYHIRVYQFSGDTNYTLSVRAENPSAPIPIFPPPLIPPDNAGNNLLLARTIGILGSTNQAYRDWVGWADNNDYYRFVTTSTTNLRLSLNGLAADADVELLDWRGSVIRRSNAAGSDPEAINVDGLGAGGYHLRVYRYGNASTYYNLNLRAETPVPPDYAGNSRDAARDIGILGTTNQSFRDWLGSPDLDDYYRFSLNRPGNLRLTISGLSADADVEVLDAQGRRVTGGLSQNSNNLPETLNLDNLGSGTYYIRVYHYSGDTYYDLNLRAESAIPQGRWIAEYYNNTSLGGNPALTRVENTLNNNWDFNAPANGINSDDFSVRWTGRFNFAGGTYRFNVRADDGIRIWINNSLILDQWILQPATDYQILRDLSPGEYQIRVEYYDHTRHAVAQVGWDRIPPPPDYAGNSMATARNIVVETQSPSNGTVVRFNDWVGSADQNDYYRFYSSEDRSDFRLNLNGLGADADVQLIFDQNRNGQLDPGEIIDRSIRGGNTSEQITRRLTEGIYYVRVYQYNGNTNYSLELSSTSVPIPRAINYILNEMTTNQSSNYVTTMAALNSTASSALVNIARDIIRLPFNPSLATNILSNTVTFLSSKLVAYGMWAERVGYNRPWDHKAEIRRINQEEFGGDGQWTPYSEVNGNNRAIEFDAFSNIHYGYIGLVSGFAQSELLEGAGLAQLLANLRRVGLSSNMLDQAVTYLNPNARLNNLSSIDDPRDQAAIRVGFGLYGTGVEQLLVTLKSPSLDRGLYRS